eukprot:6005758-Lingulodinium_polyedra.AAC.1
MAHTHAHGARALLAPACSEQRGSAVVQLRRPLEPRGVEDEGLQPVELRAEAELVAQEAHVRARRAAMQRRRTPRRAPAP